MKDFFISYNQADRQWAEWIAWQLEEAGRSVLIQAWDIRPGMDFLVEMEKAADQCQRTIAVLSPDYLKAEFSWAERRAAFLADPSGEQQKLLPIRVRPCDLPSLIGSRVYLDLVDLDEEAARQALLDGIAIGRAKPEEPVAFPGQTKQPVGATERTIPEEPRFPRALPPINNITMRRNPDFIGREELLESLEQALNSSRSAAVTQAIHGQGGIGKTQVALEYAYRHVTDYDVLWWVRCEDPVMRVTDLAGLADPLDLPEKDSQDQNRTVQAVQRWLEQNDRWLLVLDNIVEPEDVDSIVPVSFRGHVVITSRGPHWTGRAASFKVDLFTRPQSIEFLLKHVHQNARGASSGAEKQRDDDAHADALAEELGDLPLALAEAAGYLTETGESLANYLQLFRDEHERLWQHHKGPLEHPEIVAVTYDINLRQIVAETPSAADVLNICSFLHPEDIPRDLLLSHLDGDRLTLNEALAALSKYSLVDANPETLSVHRLVQAVCRDRLDDEQKQTFVQMALRLVDSAFPRDVLTNPASWSVCAQLLPHGLAATSYDDGEAGALLNQMSLYLKGRARFHEAEPLMRRALAIDEQSYGAEHPKVAICLNNLAQLLQATNRLAEAEPMLRRALAIFSSSLGDEHPHTQIVAENLQAMLK